MKHVLFFFFLLLAIGIALGRTEFCAEFNPSLAAGTTAGLLIMGWALAGSGSRRAFTAVCMAACAGVGMLSAVTSPNRTLEKKWEAAVGRLEAASSGPAVAVIEGTVSEGRRAWTDDYGRGRYSFTIGDLSGLPGRVRVSGVYKNDTPARLPAYGERVRVEGVLAIPPGRTNPAGFDWRRFLTTRGTFAVMRAERLELLGSSRGLWSGVLALRETLIRRMDAALTPAAADIAKAIFLGERSELDSEFRQSLVNTGTLHLFAISGFNVGFVAVILFGGLTLVRLPNPWKPLTVLTLLIGYAVLVGDNSPVVRAVLMAACLIAADLLRTRASALQALGAAGVLMLLMNPEECLDPAFQLSFAAVAGLALIVPLWGTLDDVRRSRSDRRLVRWRAGLTLTVLTSAAAWVTTAPILIHHFHRFSLVAPVINVLLVPVAFVLNLLLMIFSAAACAVPFAAEWFALPIEINVRLLAWLVEVFDRLPWASWNLASWSFWVWMLFGGWWVWLVRRRRDVRRSLRVVLSAAVLLVLIGIDASRAVAAAPPLRVTYFDTGQANAAIVELGPARFLIDAGRGGSADAASRTILPYLASIGASRVEAIFITHPQFDHAGGTESMLRGVNVGGIWTNGDSADAVFYRRVLDEAGRQGVPVRVLQRGSRLAGLPDGVRLTLLHPSPSFPNGGDLNERSLVLLLEAAGKKLLWTGDIGEAGLAELLLAEALFAVDVLQVPHHGSKAGVNELEFLAQTRPQVALISCGRDNSYGHPHPATLDALGQTASRIHRTDRQGAFQLTVDRYGQTHTASFNPHDT